MTSRELTNVVLRRLEESRKPKFNPPDLVRPDLSDSEYADWFLQGKFSRGFLRHEQALNDFVLFRVAYDWPRGAKNWTLDSADIYNADFSLSEDQAIDIVDFAEEGLTDGYTPATWFAKVSACWCVSKGKHMPDALFLFLQKQLFLPPKKQQGRKKADGEDRDRVIRNLFEGLCLRHHNNRGSRPHGNKGAVTRIRLIIVEALGRQGVGMTEDAVRKLCKRANKGDRESRLWKRMIVRQLLE